MQIACRPRHSCCSADWREANRKIGWRWSFWHKGCITQTTVLALASAFQYREVIASAWRCEHVFPPSGRTPLDLKLTKPAAASDRRLSGWLARHRTFVFAMALFATTRVFLFLVFRPNGYFAANSDYDFYFDFAKLTNLGFYPFLDYWLEYPPLFPWLAVLAYRVSLFLPPMPDQPIFWFRLLLGGVVYVFELANLALVYLLALEMHGKLRAWKVLAIYGTLLVPIYTWLAWFDTVPLFFMLASLWLLLRRRVYLASALAGVGFMVKIVPALALLVAARLETSWRSRLRAMLPAALAIGVLAMPFVVLAPQYLVASFVSMVDRSPWETVWALAEGYYGYGKVAPLGERFDPATAHFVTHTSWIPFPLVTVAFAAAYYSLWRRPSKQLAPSYVVLMAGLTTNIFLLMNKGYSPQFLVYVLPFLILTMPTMRGVGYATALTIANVVEWPIYHSMFTDTPWMLSAAVLLRTTLLVLLCVEYASRLFTWNWWATYSPRALRVGAVALALCCVVGVYLGIQQWYSLRYERDPLAEAFAVVRSHPEAKGAAFVFSDDELYASFYPFFNGEGDFYLFRPQHAGEHTLLSEELSPAARRARLLEILRQHGRVWVVRYADDWTAFELGYWLSGSARPEDSDYIARQKDGTPLGRHVVIQLWRGPIDFASQTPRR